MPGKVRVTVAIESEYAEVGSILRRHIGDLVEGIVGDVVVCGPDGLREGVDLSMVIDTTPPAMGRRQCRGMKRGSWAPQVQGKRLIWRAFRERNGARFQRP